MFSNLLSKLSNTVTFFIMNLLFLYPIIVVNIKKKNERDATKNLKS